MTNAPFECDVLVVGAGLSGLVCASLLQEAGLKVIVLEAAQRVGGRIHSVMAANNAYLADLGPTWVWPQYQPVIDKWLARLNVEIFPQYDQGNTVFDLGPGKAVQLHRAPGQDGIARLVGGPQALVDGALKTLTPNTVRTSHRVVKISKTDGNLMAHVEQSGGDQFIAINIVVAVPLRIAEQQINWPEDLEPSVLSAMSAVPTWMSTQAKMVALYDRPFWRANGLNGRVVSQAGPLAEVHDHCNADGGQAALFGFVGWPHELRKSRGELLKQEIIAQLVRCFGDEAAAPTSFVIEDWARNNDICAHNDIAMPPAHPELVPDILRSSQCDGRLFFAVAETAMLSPGLIEGAFVAAEATAKSIIANGKFL